MTEQNERCPSCCYDISELIWEFLKKYLAKRFKEGKKGAIPHGLMKCPQCMKTFYYVIFAEVSEEHKTSYSTLILPQKEVFVKAVKVIKEELAKGYSC
jgi:hypothetical protein